MSTNLAILNEGIVQQVGKPVDLYNNPENIFVANFLGTTNVIDGTIKDNSFTSSEGLEIKDIIDDKKGTNILLRPQNLYLHGDNNDFQNFEGIVINQEFLGNIVRYTVNVKYHLLTVDSLHEVNKKIYSLNEKIKIYLDPSKIKIL